MAQLLSRTINVNNQYQRVELTEEEQNRMQKELLEHNFRELQRIKYFLKEKSETSEETLKILAEKQLTSGFTAWQNALENKIFLIKQGKHIDFGTKNAVEKDIKQQFGEGK